MNVWEAAAYWQEIVNRLIPSCSGWNSLMLCNTSNGFESFKSVGLFSQKLMNRCRIDFGKLNRRSDCFFRRTRPNVRMFECEKLHSKSKAISLCHLSHWRLNEEWKSLERRLFPELLLKLTETFVEIVSWLVENCWKNSISVDHRLWFTTCESLWFINCLWALNHWVSRRLV